MRSKEVGYMILIISLVVNIMAINIHSTETVEKKEDSIEITEIEEMAPPSQAIGNTSTNNVSSEVNEVAENEQNTPVNDENLTSNSSFITSSEVVQNAVKTPLNNVPTGHSFKSYTSYTCLSKSSPQWLLQTQAYTDDNGLRKIGDAYLAALGSYYGTEIGTYYWITLDTGNTFKICLCDVKADKDTDPTNKFTLNNGCPIEFYVDLPRLNDLSKIMGDISHISGFEGNVISIQKIGE